MYPEPEPEPLMLVALHLVHIHLGVVVVVTRQVMGVYVSSILVIVGVVWLPEVISGGVVSASQQIGLFQCSSFSKCTVQIHRHDEQRHLQRGAHAQSL